MTFTVGDRIRLSSSFAGPSGPVDVGALPITWDCPTHEAIPDPVAYPGGISITGHMIFIAVRAGTDVELRFRDIVSKHKAFHGVLIDILPLPPITAQGVVIETPPPQDTIHSVDFVIG